MPTRALMAVLLSALASTSVAASETIPAIIAHRGASYEAPENTLAALKLAWKQGADAIEFDVFLSKDQRIVLLHDRDTKRTSGVAGAVETKTLSELQQLDVGRWKAESYAGERIPTLEQALATVPNGKRAFIEVKCGVEIVPELTRSLTRCPLKPEQTVIISFSADVIAACKKAMPQRKAYWIVGLGRNPEPRLSAESLQQTAKKIQADGLDLSAHPSITAEFVQQMERAGLPIYVWTVNDVGFAQRMRDAGVRGITTDRPGWLREELAMRQAAQQNRRVRVATFNIFELDAKKIDTRNDKGEGNDPQVRKAAEILQRLNPDILLINEIDFDGPSPVDRLEGKTPNAAERFRDLYLKIGQNGQAPLTYPHLYFRPVNTGVPTGKDLNNDGKTDGPDDAFGYGRYPGQYGMALFSKFPIVEREARTFQTLLWTDMPDNLLPDGKKGKPAFYSHDEKAIFRLSSKSHWDVPVKIGEQQLHLLCSHPTPPVFDGEEDRNGRRNFDEIRLWADYLTGGERASYIRDDRGQRGGLAANASFVILGDLNAEPVRGDAPYGKPAIRQLLDHPRVKDWKPTSEGGPASGGPASLKDYLPYKTHGFGRLDYALPSRDLQVIGTGVFWPKKTDPLHALIGEPNPSSDHRPVWIDLSLPVGR